MKKWFIKQKYKLFISLCSILSIFILFLGINKTYAYETDKLTYTLDSYSIDNTNWISFSNKNNIILSVSNDYIRFRLLDNTNLRLSYLLINYQYLDSNYNVINTGTYQRRSVTPHIVYNYANDTIQDQQCQSLYINDGNYNRNDFFTNIIPFTYTASRDNALSINNLYVLFNSLFAINVNNTYVKILNIDYVDSSHIGLDYYYETYYGQIEDNYNTLLDNYNTLQDDYSTLEGNYNILESNYSNLTNEYNNLSNNINSFANSGVLQYIQTIDFELISYDRQNYWNKEYTLLEFMQTNYFTNTNFIDINLLFNDWIHEVNTSDSALLYVTINFIPIDIDFFNLVTNDISNISFRSISLNNNLTITLNNVNRVTKSSIESSYGSNLDNTQVINIYVEYNTLNSDINTDNSIFTDLSISQVSYNRGFQMGKQQSESLILELNNKISANEQTIQDLQNELEFSTSTNRDLVTQIDNLKIENDRFRRAISSLEAQLRSYQESSNDYNLNRMIWTIASTPFESFKQIWNVDFFGVNISSMITGFITGIIVLWIIKKFFL